MATAARYRDDLAWVHHTGFADLARGAAPALIRLLGERGILAGTVVDLGCGSGLVLAALARAGYSPVGVDLSSAMLKLAARTAPSARLRKGSLYRVDLPTAVAVFAVGEPLNYVEAGAAAQKEAALAPFFDKVAAALVKGGVFAFDVIVGGRPSLSRARAISGKGFDLFVTTRDEGRVLWRDVVCFAQKPGQAGYTRSHELHRVRVLETRTLLRQLRRAGFSVRVSPGYGDFALPVRRRAFLCIRR